MIHEIKCWSEYFHEIISGNKTFELRKNDRDFKVGDVLHLREYNPERKYFTDRSAMFEVKYILHGGQFGLEEGYVIMSIK